MPLSPSTIIRNAVVRVEIYRGLNAGREGFWVRQSCEAERLSGLAFVWTHDKVMPSDTSIAEGILAFNDDEAVGISGRGCPVQTLQREDDIGVFEVVANVKRAAT